EDKIAADTTLYTVLTTMAKLTAPYTPFMAEQMYQNLTVNFYPDAPKSVHLCAFPQADESYIDKALEESMDLAEKVTVLGRSARNAGNLKIRQPLSELYVVSDKEIELDEELQAIVLSELNVKSYQKAEDAGRFVTYTLKPQLKTLGRKCGKKIPLLNKFLAECDAKAVVEAVKNGGNYKVDLEGEVELLEEDLQIFTGSAEGFVNAADGGISVYLNTTLTEQLVMEGVERELVSKIQTMRKEAGFEVVDRIYIYYTAEGKALTALQNKNFAADVLANDVVEGNREGYTKELDVNGDKVTLTVVKA
ncbi:MAG: class I tRNA ligase family protein, partial [Clostridia bacterium]|nr:class I tRNA ligase family protein [Clostridia bacterium]